VGPRESRRGGEPEADAPSDIASTVSLPELSGALAGVEDTLSRATEEVAFIKDRVSAMKNIISRLDGSERPLEATTPTKSAYVRSNIAADRRNQAANKNEERLERRRNNMQQSGKRQIDAKLQITNEGNEGGTSGAMAAMVL